MKNHELFYKNIEVVKGSINKTLINSDYVTFYEFKLIQNNKQLRVLKKRFTDFVFLHEALERWMKNTKIVYKMISLPEKHLYKSQNHRQEKLKNYLANLIKIKDIYQVYAVNTFFNAGSDNFLEDLSSSGIEVS